MIDEEITFSKDDYALITKEITGGKGYVKDYYFGKWKNLINKSKIWGGFNISAFFFGITWVLWRRIYPLLTFTILLKISLGMAIPVIIRLFFSDNQSLYNNMILNTSMISSIIVSLFLGVFANNIYFMHSNEIIRKAKNSSSNSIVVQKRIEAKGGYNNIFVAILLAMCIEWFYNVYLQLLLGSVF